MTELTRRDARARLAVPTVAMLPKIADSLSFLYLDIVRVVQDDTGVCAQIETRRGTETVYIPTAALSCVLLGPGTSVTSRAMATFARHGTTVVFVGAGVVRTYSGVQPSSLTTTWLEHQVRAWANEDSRLDVARRMYHKRFDDDLPEDITLAQLRGLEGHRMKAVYRLHAERQRIGRFKRNYDPERWHDQDPVNVALSAANVCLYGVAHAAVLAMGCSPALGFVHTGTQHSFLFDIADLYKAELTIPLAFASHDSPDPEQAVRRHLREGMRLFRFMPRIVTDIQNLLAPESNTPLSRQPESDLVYLWDPQHGALASGINYAEGD
ncbi:CRISPR-associated protein Cas1 [Catenulispora sp. EB89]|uniref:type I-E CRISPR-associated endonuclease Cas1e n=1 Tax=Catenulispora sp. EB89 TaxID=3156257 RepID=UPI003512F5E8